MTAMIPGGRSAWPPLLFVLATFTGLSRAQSDAPATTSQRLDDFCLTCICHASTSCNPEAPCPDGGNCGPYQISRPYWIDAGSPSGTDTSAFERCAKNQTCAEATVHAYMNRWQTDCDQDRHIDCLDYAAIHKIGPFGCTNQTGLTESEYWKLFSQCYIDRPLGKRSVRSAIIVTRTSSSASSSYRSSSFRSSSAPSSSSSIIEIPAPTRPNFPFELPPVVARASASVPGASASAEASAGLQPESVSAIASSNIDDGHENVEYVTTRHRTFVRPVKPIPPLPSSLLVPSSSHFKPDTATRVVFTGSQPHIVSEADNGPGLIVTSSRGSNTEEPVRHSRQSGTVSQQCLQCLCQASTKCDLSQGCQGAYCGPYLLSWGYWADGGQPGYDYAACSNQKQCAEQAIQGYMAKWKTDCNRDGRIDCLDYALIHKLGPHGCGQLQALHDTDYWRQFQQCWAGEPASPTPPRPAEIELERDDSERRADDDSGNYRIIINNRDAEDSSLREIPQPVNRIVITPELHNNRPRPILIRIKPPAGPPPLPPPPPPPPPPTRERPVTTTTRAPPREVVEDYDQPGAAARPTEPVDYFSEPRPSDSSASSNVFEVHRSSQPPRASNLVLTNRTRTENNRISRECLECICYASSRCNQQIGCQNAGGFGKYICGPYQIDWEYWAEAGKPGNRADLSNLENFQMCANNRECADQAVQAYLSPQTRDCNEDGTIDCNDWAALHLAGPGQCAAQWYLDSKYYSDFRECFDF